MKYHHLLIVALVVFLGGSFYLGFTPPALAVLFLMASAITYFLYAKDKAAAQAGAWRVSENTLHMGSLLFGWPGALIAQQRLRHKTKKQSFRAYFWLTVLLNLGCIAWIHTPQGNHQLRQSLYWLDKFTVSHVPYRAPVSAALFLTKFHTPAVRRFR